MAVFLCALCVAAEPVSLAERAAEPETRAQAKQEKGDLSIDAEVLSRILDTFLFVGGGSGVVISPDGYALTNFHVASSLRAKFTVTRTGGEVLKARVVGHDPEGDLTLLKVSCDRPLPYAQIRASATVVAGEPAIAVGNPFMLGMQSAQPTVTRGVVSSPHVTMDVRYANVILTDAAINPGNSGGPLFDEAGRLIGINGRIQTRFQTRFNTGAGYAIASDYITTFLPELLACQGGYIGHAQIAGLVLRSPPWNRQMATGGSPEMIVDRVVPGSPADRAGFQPGDLIIAVDGRPIQAPGEVTAILQRTRTGRGLRVSVERGGEGGNLRRTVELTVQTSPKPAIGWSFAMLRDPARDLGWRLAAPSAKEPTANFLEVAEVAPGSPADRAGVRLGDRLQAISFATGRALALSAEALNKGVTPANPQEAQAPLIATLVRSDGPETKNNKEETRSVRIALGDPVPALRFHATLGFRFSAREGREAKKGEEGLVVEAVSPGSPAEAAGLIAGARIRAVGGKPVSTHWDFLDAVSDRKVGETLELELAGGAGGAGGGGRFRRATRISISLAHYPTAADPS